MPRQANTPNPIGVRMRSARRRAGLSQAELAEMTALNPDTISRIESGFSQSPQRTTRVAIRTVLAELEGSGRE